MKKVPLVCLLLLFSLQAASAGGFGEISKDYTLQFPRDFYYRDGYRLQWWYFTGHLFTPEGREFGYELTFFVAGVQRKEFRSRFGVRNIYVSHFALSDLKDDRYSSFDSADSGAYGFAGADDSRLHVWVDNNELVGTTSRMHLAASGGDKTLDLTLVPAKPVVLNGDRGYSRKSEESPEIASWYFSYPDLKTGGNLVIGGVTFPVTGKSWFDREISSGTMGKSEKGWDWFSVQLDDGRDLMLYLMRNKDGTLDRFSSGTFVYPDGRYRHLALGDYSVTVLGHYTSKKTGAVYPSGWRVRIPSENLDLRITPLIEDQEFVASSSTGNYYWEGDCTVAGSAAGRAYVELTGY
jgi:predicted secreted hydrolase